jgi:citrate synthase
MTPYEGDVPPMVTSIGRSQGDKIWVHGFNLVDELIGAVDFGAMFFLLVTGRLPSASEATMFNATLVALADHGLTPTALAARLTYTGAPDSIQGAVAAGILGAGSTFLGVFEDTGRMLMSALPSGDPTDDSLAESAARLVAEYTRSGRRIPGLGHPFYKDADPRTAKLLELAKSNNALGPHTRLLLHVHRAVAAARNAPLPLNAGGVCGALLCDLGIEPAALRGVAVVSRAAGLVGHIVEEARQPIGPALWYLAERETTYKPPA